MKISAVVSTKGGVGKTTIEANLGAFCADAGLRVLLIDLDPAQPSLSSYYQLVDEAQGASTTCWHSISPNQPRSYPAPRYQTSRLSFPTTSTTN